MRISLSPQRRDTEPLQLERQGDVLLINGTPLDFSPLQEGEVLPGEAISHEMVVGAVRRQGGRIEIRIILPHGHDAPEETRYPVDIVDPPNGVVSLPPYSAG